MPARLFHVEQLQASRRHIGLASSLRHGRMIVAEEDQRQLHRVQHTASTA